MRGKEIKVSGIGLLKIWFLAIAFSVFLSLKLLAYNMQRKLKINKPAEV